MDKLSFAFILILILSGSCVDKPKDIYQKIGGDFWNNKHRNYSKDSLLLIDKYGQDTKGYTRFWVALKSRPLEVTKSLKTSLQIVDQRTIYRDIRQESFSDYKQLLQRGMIRLVKLQRIDDSLEGYLYIVKNGAPDQFVAIPLPEYFQTLSEKSRHKEPQIDQQQELLYDEVASYYFNKLGSTFTNSR